LIRQKGLKEKFTKLLREAGYREEMGLCSAMWVDRDGEWLLSLVNSVQTIR
jgi:hypothetical protein